MTYSFDVSADVNRGIVTVRLSGFFSLEAVSLISADMERALRTLNMGPNSHTTLVDVTGCQIQSQEMVAEFQKLVSEPYFRSRRLAFVTGGSLIKMQLRRLIKDASYASIFGDDEAAMDWLMEASPRRVAPAYRESGSMRHAAAVGTARADEH